jgi:hypothetical protein
VIQGIVDQHIHHYCIQLYTNNQCILLTISFTPFQHAHRPQKIMTSTPVISCVVPPREELPGDFLSVVLEELCFPQVLLISTHLVQHLQHATYAHILLQLCARTAHILSLSQYLCITNLIHRQPKQATTSFASLGKRILLTVFTHPGSITKTLTPFPSKSFA